MTTQTTNTLQVLADLLSAEQAGLFHFMADADPHISRASAATRRPLQQMIADSRRQEYELTALISEMGGTVAPIPVNMEHQYIAFLDTEFLLPKLRDAKEASIDRYEKAIKQIDGGDSMLEALLAAHLNDHRRDLATLKKFIQS